MGKLLKIGFAVLVMIVFLLSLNYYYGYVNYLGIESFVNSIQDNPREYSPDRCDEYHNFRKEEFRDTCYFKVAFQFLDTKFCDKMMSIEDKESCKIRINRANDLEGCLNYSAERIKNLPQTTEHLESTETTWCYVNYAFLTNNYNLCEQSLNKDLCYILLASKGDFNIEVCGKISDVIKKDFCYLEGILIKNDPSLCTKISYTPQNELQQISHQIRTRDICFYYFAKKEKKSEICDGIKIGDLRRHCKLDVSTGIFYLIRALTDF